MVGSWADSMEQVSALSVLMVSVRFVHECTSLHRQAAVHVWSRMLLKGRDGECCC